MKLDPTRLEVAAAKAHDSALVLVRVNAYTGASTSATFGFGVRLVKAILSVATVTFALLAAAAPLLAHHSFAAEYDGKKPITLHGVVTRIDWLNPHVYIYLDVKDDSGNVLNWALEGHPPNTLRRTGWTKDALKVGDTITVQGWRSKDDSLRIAGREVTLPDSKKLFLGPPAE